MVERAYSALADPALAALKRKVILVGTDLTARSWAGVQPGAFAGEGKDTVECYLLDVGVEENLNVALAEPTAEPPLALPGGAVDVTVPVSVGAAAGKVKLDLAVAGPITAGPRQPAPPLREAKYVDPSEREVLFGLPNQQRTQDFETIIRHRRGLYFGRVRVLGTDVLEADNTRWVAFRVGRLPVALVAGSATRNSAAFLLANAISPQTPAERARRQIEVRHMAPDALPAADLSGVDTIWLAGAAPLAPELWPVLRRFAAGGGAVIVVPGEGSRVSDLATAPAESLLGVGKVRDVALPAETAVRMGPADYRSELLADFKGGRQGDLANVYVRRAWTFEVTGPGRVTLGRIGLPDGRHTPLIVAGRVGKGHVLLWSTGPQRTFSDLSRNAAELIVLVRSSIKYLTGEYRARAGFLLGSAVQFPLPRDWPAVGGAAELYLPDGSSKPVRLDPGQRVVLGEAARVGPHALLLRRSRDDKQGLVIGYAVNSDPAESDLTPVDRSRLVNPNQPAAGAFRPEACSIVSDADGLRRSQARRTRGWDVSALLALGMLVLLCGESFFSNRFYRRPPPAAETLEATRKLD
jgi:hypothetical protein